MGNTGPRLTAQTLKVLGVLLSCSADGVSGAEVGRETNVLSGTLYPILLRLEDAGWVKSRWETEDPRELGRPRRRLCRITGIGMRKARAALREFVLPLKEFAWR